MPRCPECQKQFRIPEDELFMHGCPRCGNDYDEEDLICEE